MKTTTLTGKVIVRKCDCRSGRNMDIEVKIIVDCAVGPWFVRVCQASWRNGHAIEIIIRHA